MSQKVGKGRLAQVTIALPIPATATPEEIQQWVAHKLNGTGVMPVTHPLAGKRFDPIKVDINITPNFVEFEARNMHYAEGNKINYEHAARAVFDRRSTKEINAWKDRLEVFNDSREKLLAQGGEESGN